jgi:hypothetical protein
LTSNSWETDRHGLLNVSEVELEPFRLERSTNSKSEHVSCIKVLSWKIFGKEGVKTRAHVEVGIPT